MDAADSGRNKKIKDSGNIFFVNADTLFNIERALIEA